MKMKNSLFSPFYFGQFGCYHEFRCSVESSGGMYVVKQVSVFVLSELVRQKHERYMVHTAYIYSVA
jgi:hypothetical protein